MVNWGKCVKRRHRRATIQSFGCPARLLTEEPMPTLWGRQFTREELMQRVGRLEQVAGVRVVEHGDGMERGVRVLEFRTGSGFSFDVLLDRAMDIGRCEHDGRALGWQSGTGFIGPWYYEPEELGWLRGFGGGLLTTCGMEHALFMAEDTAEQ